MNNAGIGAQGDLASNEDDERHRVWDINVVGMARVTRAAHPYLRESSSASVVDLSSVLATAGVPQRVLYTATKGAVLSMTRAMAADHLREGIGFNAVNPGTPTADMYHPARLQTLWPTSRARGQVPRLVRPSRSTEVCKGCGCRDSGSNSCD